MCAIEWLLGRALIWNLLRNPPKVCNEGGTDARYGILLKKKKAEGAPGERNKPWDPLTKYNTATEIPSNSGAPVLCVPLV